MFSICINHTNFIVVPVRAVRQSHCFLTAQHFSMLCSMMSWHWWTAQHFSMLCSDVVTLSDVNLMFSTTHYQRFLRRELDIKHLLQKCAEKIRATDKGQVRHYPEIEPENLRKLHFNYTISSCQQTLASEICSQSPILALSRYWSQGQCHVFSEPNIKPVQCFQCYDKNGVVTLTSNITISALK